MKNHIYIVSLITILLSSCEDPATEGITLEPIEFPFAISPDTISINIGEVFSMHCSVANEYGIKNGEINIHSGVSYYNDTIITPITATFAAVENNHYDLEIINGDIHHTNGQVNAFLAEIDSDSLRIYYRFKFLKAGIYHFYLSSSFFESDIGKGRTEPLFSTIDPHWDFFSGWDQPNPNPIDPIYYKSYLIEVKQ